jgi:hypothetical protein
MIVLLDLNIVVYGNISIVMHQLIKDKMNKLNHFLNKLLLVLVQDYVEEYKEEEVLVMMNLYY